MIAEQKARSNLIFLPPDLTQDSQRIHPAERHDQQQTAKARRQRYPAARQEFVVSGLAGIGYHERRFPTLTWLVIICSYHFTFPFARKYQPSGMARKRTKPYIQI